MYHISMIKGKIINIVKYNKIIKDNLMVLYRNIEVREIIICLSLQKVKLQLRQLKL